MENSVDELITELEITETPDGGATLSVTLSKELVQIILTQWIHNAIKSETEKVLKEHNELFEQVPEETSAVSKEDGSASKITEASSIFPKREYDYLGRPIYPNDPIADGK